MQKQSRAYFGVFRINRLTLIVVGLLVVAMATYRFNPVQRVTSIVDRIAGSRVASDVALEDQAVGGKSAEELRLIVESLASERGMAPQDAIFISEGKRYEVVPDVSGRQVDLEATVAEVLTAAPGSRVQLVYRETPARTTMAMYPDAPVFRGNPAKQAVSFAVNVAWDRNNSLAAILKAFRAANARTTFFITGRWAQANPEAVRQIVADGHEIASHGHDDRKEPLKMSLSELAEDIRLAKETLEQVSGQPVRLYSPHMSQINRDIARIAADLQLRPVLYSLDTIDWRNPTPAVLVNRIVDGVENGSIILVHPTPSTAAAIDRALSGVTARGYQIVTVGELLSPGAASVAARPPATGNAPASAPQAPGLRPQGATPNAPTNRGTTPANTPRPSPGAPPNANR